MSPANSQLPIGAQVPRLRLFNLIVHFRKVGRTLNRISDRREKDVWIRPFDVLDGGFNIGELLALIAPHEEHARLYSMGTTQSHRLLNLFHGHAAFHGIKNSLGAAL